MRLLLCDGKRRGFVRDMRVTEDRLALLAQIVMHYSCQLNGPGTAWIGVLADEHDQAVILTSEGTRTELVDVSAVGPHRTPGAELYVLLPVGVSLNDGE